MIASVVRSIVTFILSFFGEVNRAIEESVYGPQASVSEADVSMALMMARDPNRVIRPFGYHMGKFFTGEGELTRADIVENMNLSLESLSEEIRTHTPESTISSHVERDKDSEGALILGHLDWKVDIPNPKVYAISLDLLKDGFMFRADSKTFVITGRVPE